MINKEVGRSRCSSWNQVLGVLLAVSLLVALLLMATARSFDEPEQTATGHLDIRPAVHETTTESVGSGTTANQLPRTDRDPVALCSVNWRR